MKSAGAGVGLRSEGGVWGLGYWVVFSMADGNGNLPRILVMFWSIYLLQLSSIFFILFCFST